MSTEETKVTTNEPVAETTESTTADPKGTEVSPTTGNPEPGTTDSKEDKSKEVNERILEFLKEQSDTIKKQNEMIDKLTKANEEIHKKMSQVENRVDKNTPTVFGSYNFDAELKNLSAKDLESYETKAKETLNFISTQFNIN